MTTNILARATWPAALLTAAGALLAPSEASAFREAGHRAIEAAAYRDLLASGEIETVRALIKYGVLDPPSAPLPPATDLLDPEYASVTVNSLVVHSHFPDHHFDRQLQANRQCFHFNAAGGHYKLTDRTLPGSRIPVGLSENAYVECVGVADALLRGILFDPRGSHKLSNSIYTLMHMVEDSFADSHVARETPGWAPVDIAAASMGCLSDQILKGQCVAPDPDSGPSWKVVYIKPWNLRTWPRYFLGNKHSPAIRSHFSAEHHMGSDTRDLGYLIGPTDEHYRAHHQDERYRRQMRECVEQAGRMILRHREAEYSEAPINIEDLQGEIVVPTICLSQRARRASLAVRELLVMVAKLMPKVRAPIGPNKEAIYGTGVKEVDTLEQEWRSYRYRFLGHYDPYLTHWMSTRPRPGRLDPPGATELKPAEPRKDLVSSSEELSPRNFRESALGLTAELRSGTPLWLGIEEFLSRNTSNHNRPVLLLDSLGWGVQVRLPVENERGERPAGAALDVGAGLPLPISELFGLNELQIYAGVRGRIAYTAQSVFEAETRHAIEVGFGGVSLDFVVGNTAWFGLDAPRAMYLFDFWANHGDWQPMLWSFSAGVAIDAF